MPDLLNTLRLAVRSKEFRVAISAVRFIDRQDGGPEVLERSLGRGLLVHIRNEEAGKLGVFRSGSLDVMVVLHGSGLYIVRVAGKAQEVRLPCVYAAVYPVKGCLRRLIRGQEVVFLDVLMDKCPACGETFVSARVLFEIENSDEGGRDQAEAGEGVPDASLEPIEPAEEAAENMIGAFTEPAVNTDKDAVDCSPPPADTGEGTVNVSVPGPAATGQNRAGTMDPEPVNLAVRAALDQLSEDGKYVSRRDLAMLLGLLWPER
ncbi:MAG: hypothetical protein ACOYU7_04085 [Bacillota bacterium]